MASKWDTSNKTTLPAGQHLTVLKALGYKGSAKIVIPQLGSSPNNLSYQYAQSQGNAGIEAGGGSLATTPSTASLRKAGQQAAGSRAAQGQSSQEGVNKVIGAAMVTAAGWGKQWNAFNNLVMSESGWNTTISNPSSGAYGIPQALPGSKMASAGKDWKTNPITQIAWMIGYIKSRYGDPNHAWAFHQANNWY